VISFTLIISMSIGSLIGIAADEEDRAPYVSDWGIFDESTGKTTSLADSGVVDGDSANRVFYVRFNHNVAEPIVAENNCGLISIVSAGGKHIDSKAWVKDTQLEFQYRQYIFITVTGDMDTTKYYHIKVSPGVTAKNGYTNKEGTSLYFSFTTSGPGDEPTPITDPEEEQDPEPDPSTKPSTNTETKPDSSKETNKTKDNNKTGKTNRSTDPTKKSTQRARPTNPSTRPAVPATRNNPTVANRPTTASSATETKERKIAYRIDSDVFIDPAAQSYYDEQDPDAYGYVEGGEGASTMEIGALIMVIAMCLTTAAAGALSEEISFRRRLRHG
jgi:hypothetical protein